MNKGAKTLHPRISIAPKIMVGKPCIKGTRITVEHILNELASGQSIAELLENYPRLVEEDIAAALRYAATQVSRIETVAAE